MNQEDRRKDFKKTVDNETGRRRRQETTMQIRKNKKEENMRKRRLAAETSSVAVNNEMASQSSKKRPSVDDIPTLKAILLDQASSREQIVEATRGFRRILSVERNPPVEEVVNACGVVEKLIYNLCADPTAAVLIFESAWALTNIASTSRTEVVVSGGAVKPMIQLLQHENADVREQAAWCLGNIAGDNREFRDSLLAQGALQPLLLNIYQPACMSLLNNVTWAISNLCRGKPSPDFAIVGEVIEPLAMMLEKEVTNDVRVDALWALSYLSDGPNDRIGRVMATGVTDKLIEFLGDVNSPMLVPTLRCLGNFVTGSDLQTQAVIDAGVLKCLPALLESTRRTIRKEACWLTSNIGAGTHNQISRLLSQRTAMDLIVDNAMEGAFEVKKEAVWTLSNICTTGNDDHVMAVVQYEGIRPLAAVLGAKTGDPIIITAALDAIERILEVGERFQHDYALMFDEYCGIENLENLQEHPSDDVYKKTVDIIETYFGGDEEEDENIAPATTDTGTFGFGISSPKQLFTSSTTAAPIQFGLTSPNRCN